MIARELPALLKPREVAELFRVTRRTVDQWHRLGRLTCVRTPGGHRRYRRAEVEALMLDQATTQTTPGSWT